MLNITVEQRAEVVAALNTLVIPVNQGRVVSNIIDFLLGLKEEKKEAKK